jgi:hypothetical protein
MIIAKSINQYNNNYVYFCNPIKNNIIYDGKFIRIIYSTPQLIMNGIFLHLELLNVSCEKNFNKYKYSFNIEKNNSIIEEIKNIEQQFGRDKKKSIGYATLIINIYFKLWLCLIYIIKFLFRISLVYFINFLIMLCLFCLINF